MRRAISSTDHQHDQRVGIGGAAVEVELEAAEQRAHHDALQAVGAAGEARACWPVRRASPRRPA